MKSTLRSEFVHATDVHMIYKGSEAIATVQRCPVFPDDPVFEDFKWIAQLRQSSRALGEFESLKAAMNAIYEATQ